MEDRKITLLKAALEIFEKCDASHFVASPFEVTAFYDGTECDGYCLMEDIKYELGDVVPKRGRT